jgi:hypothetical protein
MQLLNENTGMNCGSGDVECEGMSVDGDAVTDQRGWELMLTLTNLSRTWSLAMSVRALEVPGAMTRSF